MHTLASPWRKPSLAEQHRRRVIALPTGTHNCESIYCRDFSLSRPLEQLQGHLSDNYIDCAFLPICTRGARRLDGTASRVLCTAPACGLRLVILPSTVLPLLIACFWHSEDDNHLMVIPEGQGAIYRDRPPTGQHTDSVE